jgi:hypothetical protein
MLLSNLFVVDTNRICDTQGHGMHALSTAVDNFVPRASLFALRLCHRHYQGWRTTGVCRRRLQVLLVGEIRH